ncbi:MAG: hypothetical protein V2I63_01865 [Pseudomonadales bacterium]|jgi:hypothetical protein|nr:hypothetical protein [Pseudomonadales bacterium]
MRPVFADAVARRQGLMLAAAILAITAVATIAATLIDVLPLRMAVGVLALGSVLVLLALSGISVQRGVLGQAASPGPRTVLAWAGTLLATVAGPLITAKLVVAVIALVSLALVPADGAGAFAGVGIAWLVLPMALLVTGTAALKLPAVAVGLPLDTREAIRLADGREWSLLPLGLVLTTAVFLVVLGVGAAGFGSPLGLVAVALGIALFLPVSAAVARRYRSLQPAP